MNQADTPESDLLNHNVSRRSSQHIMRNSTVLMCSPRIQMLPSLPRFGMTFMSSTKSTSRLLSNVNAEYEIKAVLWTAVKLDAWSLIAITPRFGTPSADSGVSDLRQATTHSLNHLSPWSLKLLMSPSELRRCQGVNSPQLT